MVSSINLYVVSAVLTTKVDILNLKVLILKSFHHFRIFKMFLSKILCRMSFYQVITGPRFCPVSVNFRTIGIFFKKNLYLIREKEISCNLLTVMVKSAHVTICSVMHTVAYAYKYFWWTLERLRFTQKNIFVCAYYIENANSRKPIYWLHFISSSSSSLCSSLKVTCLAF